MEIKKVTKTIEVELYVASDGKEFEDEEEASIYEIKVIAEKLFEIDYDMINSPANVYVIINNAEEAHLLSSYIEEVHDFSCYIEFDTFEINEPTLVRYDADGYLRIVSQEEYAECKRLCNIYEKTIKS